MVSLREVWEQRLTLVLETIEPGVSHSARRFGA
jgi:hypothetical protein